MLIALCSKACTSTKPLRSNANDSSRAYFLVTSSAAAERQEVKDFAAWLRRQAKQESHLPKSLGGGPPRRAVE